MARIFFPGCKIKAAHPEASAWLAKVVLERGWADEITGCCKVNTPNLSADDTAVVICTNCLAIVSEGGKQSNVETIWELIDACPDFPLPNYGGREIALQDCGRTWDNPRMHDTVRSLLAKMNLRVVELPDARDKSVYCGFTFLGQAAQPDATYAPKRYVQMAAERGYFTGVPADEQLALLEEHSQSIPTNEVACYCGACEAGLNASGKQAYHLLELIKGVDW